MPHHIGTHDVKLTPRQLRREAAHFAKVYATHNEYAIKLRKIARHTGDIIKEFKPGDLIQLQQLLAFLSQYSAILKPWAVSTAQLMVTQVARRDVQAWFKNAQHMSYAMKEEIRNAPTGEVMRQILEGQVHLITSIPLEAGQRVQQLTQEYIAGGRRYAELVPLVLDSGNVTAARATLIARTETAKAASALTQARALHIGSTHYIWMTSNDYKVRESHKILNGKTFAWSDPPVAEQNGERHHPGQFPNCRCHAAPIIPEVII